MKIIEYTVAVGDNLSDKSGYNNGHYIKGLACEVNNLIKAGWTPYNELVIKTETYTAFHKEIRSSSIYYQVMVKYEESSKI